MLLFSTLLDINEKLTKEAFIRLVIKWNQGSPHKSNVIPGVKWHGERNVRYGDDKLWLAIEEYRNKEIIAVRFEKKEEDGSIWDTDFIMNFEEMKLAVRLDRSYTQEALSADSTFSTPHLVTLLINNGYLKNDDNLPVIKEPISIDEENLQIIADVINGEKRYKLPVVYISRTRYDEDPVNVSLLANKLKGLAHVLVQNSSQTNAKLRRLCHGQNEYFGAIGIYYPNSAIAPRRYLYRNFEGYDSFLFGKVIRAVFHYSNQQMIDSLYTWQGVNNAILMDRLIKQRAERLAAEDARKRAEEEAAHLLDIYDEEERKIRRQALEDAKNEAEKILEGFDEDMQRLQRQINDLSKTVETLQLENQGLRAKLDNSDSIPILFMGDEYDFYQGEIKDLILSVLADSLDRIPTKTRRYDVVKDIVKNNNYEKQSELRADEVKRLLRDFNGMSGRLKKDLMDLGFEISNEGRHYKLSYYGDGRYQIILANTPSDGRSGKNNALTIIRKSF